MKFLEATILVILCAGVLCFLEGEPTDPVSTCCVSYVSRKIPQKIVVAYFETSSKCPQHGVVFLTKKGRHICANPSDAWVQEYITTMQEVPARATFPADSRNAD